MPKQGVEPQELLDELNAYIDAYCTSTQGDCNIPITVSAAGGDLTLNNLNIEYSNFYWDTSFVPEGSNYRVMVAAAPLTFTGGTPIYPIITSPTPGKYNNEVIINWNAASLGTNIISYNVLFSADSGQTWQYLAQNYGYETNFEEGSQVTLTFS